MKRRLFDCQLASRCEAGGWRTECVFVQRDATGKRCFHWLRCRRVGRHQISFEPGLSSDSLLSLVFVRTAVCVKPAPLTLRREKTADAIWRRGSTFIPAGQDKPRRKSFRGSFVACFGPDSGSPKMKDRSPSSQKLVRRVHWEQN